MSDENNQPFAIAYKVEDDDDDFDTGTLNIDVDDDTPTVTASLAVRVTVDLDETQTTSEPATFGVVDIGNDPDVGGAGRIDYDTSGTSVVTPGGSYGADGAGTLGHELTVTKANSGLQVTDGSAINLVDEGDDAVTRQTLTVGHFFDERLQRHELAARRRFSDTAELQR